MNVLLELNTAVFVANCNTVKANSKIVDTESRSFLSTLEDYSVPLHQYFQDILAHTQDFYKQEADRIPRQTGTITAHLEGVQKIMDSLQMNEDIASQGYQQLKGAVDEGQGKLANVTSHWSSTLVDSTRSLCSEMEQSGVRTYEKVSSMELNKLYF